MKRKIRPPPPEQPKMTVSLTEEQLHRVKLMAKASEVTLSAFVRGLIQERWSGFWPADQRDPYT